MGAKSLGMRYLIPHQINKEIIVNENFKLLEKLLNYISFIAQPNISSIETNPNATSIIKNSSTNYIVGKNPIGEWQKRTDQIAIYCDGKWEYFYPSEGLMVFVAKENAVYIFVKNNWKILKKVD